jgi:hypothetical protein
MVTMWH